MEKMIKDDDSMCSMKRILISILTAFMATAGIFAQLPGPGRKLNNEIDSSQYVIGLYFARYLEANNLEITDNQLFDMGLADGIAGTSTLVEKDSITPLMTNMIFKATKEANIKAENELFASLKSMEGIKSTPGGVYYTIRKVGTGPLPTLNDSVIINYKGYLPKGALFQDSYAVNSPLRITPEGLIEGMKEAIQLMPEGSIWRMYIPSSQAYGEAGIAGLIPNYSAVIFDVELMQVKAARRNRTNRNR